MDVHKKMHDNQTPKWPTIESLDNLEEHYYQIDQDANITFSDNDDDNEADDEFGDHQQQDFGEIIQEEKIEVNNIQGFLHTFF